MPPIRDRAVCVREWDWSETSQTVLLFTREHGLIRGVAKGSRRPLSPFSGGLGVLTVGEVVGYPARAGLSTIAEWDLTDPLPAARASLPAFHAGMLMMEVIQQAVTDHDPHPALFDALLDALHGLADRPRASALGLLWVALVETGHEPLLDAGKPAAPARSTALGFDARSGAIVADPGQGATGSVWRMRADTARVLRSLREPSPIAEQHPGLNGAGRLLAAYLGALVGRELRTAGLTFGTTPGR